jgi:hypothetical protein
VHEDESRFRTERAMRDLDRRGGAEGHRRPSIWLVRNWRPVNQNLLRGVHPAKRRLCGFRKIRRRTGHGASTALLTFAHVSDNAALAGRSGCNSASGGAAARGNNRCMQGRQRRNHTGLGRAGDSLPSRAAYRSRDERSVVMGCAGSSLGAGRDRRRSSFSARMTIAGEWVLGSSARCFQAPKFGR